MTQMIDAPPDSAVTNRDQGTPPPAGNLPTPSAPPVQVLDAKRVNSPAGERGLQLKSYDELARFSATVYKSGLAPKGFDTAEAVFVAAPPRANTSPAEGHQYFGQVDIDGATGELTVRLRDLDGRTLFTQPLMPAESARHRGR